MSIATSVTAGSSGRMEAAEASAYRATLASPYGREVERDVLRTLEPLGTRGRVWIGSLVAVCAFAVFAYTLQLIYGLQMTGMRDIVSWGLYMTNFVFFIGISHAGTLISAILRVTNADWRRPITRMAEAITVFALLVGASMVIVDMGRPDRLLNVFRHGRLQSPILWDVCSITTYLTGSFLYLYVAMIPDLPILARRARERVPHPGRERGSPRLARFYDVLSLGYRGTPEQERLLNRALAAMAVIIIPVAVSVHTVVSWVFGMTVRPGWHSTIFGPYFVVGAIFSGTAAIITAMAIFRRAYHLERYLTIQHFRHLAKLLLVLTFLYTYFTLSEYLTTWYGGLSVETRLLRQLMGGTQFGLAFWAWALLGLLPPIALLLFPGRRSLGAIITASVLINIGMWLKRYLIVVPTMETPFIPAEAAGITLRYFPTWIEWAVTLGAFAAFLLLFTMFSRWFPIVSIWETAEGDAGVRAAGPPERTGAARHAGAFPVMVVALATAAATLVARPAFAAVPQGPARVDLTRTVEGGEQMLLAVVTVDGKPVPDARIAFFVRRTFGDMTLGEDVTLEDGSAAVSYPGDLPADSTGNLRVRAVLVEPDELAGASGEAVIAGAPPPPTTESVERALWSARVPLGLLLTIVFLLVSVWGTYAFVIGQLAKIPKHGKEVQR